MASIDLNSDLGEGFGHWSLGDDNALLEIVTSANVACGYHASDASIMHRVCDAAVQHGVSIGAQVGYRDLPGFGRRFIDIEPQALTDDVIYQVAALDGFARIAGDRVRYLKPHGALYNAIVHHEEQAAAVVSAVRQYDSTLPVLGLPGSAWLRLAEEGGLRVGPQQPADQGGAAAHADVLARLPLQLADFRHEPRFFDGALDRRVEGDLAEPLRVVGLDDVVGSAEPDGFDEEHIGRARFAGRTSPRQTEASDLSGFRRWRTSSSSAPRAMC